MGCLNSKYNLPTVNLSGVSTLFFTESMIFYHADNQFTISFFFSHLPIQILILHLLYTAIFSLHKFYLNYCMFAGT